jgi:hypothetical protein
MYELSLGDINKIRGEISRQDICFSHLLDELIDHVCCDVESEMSKGLDFDHAFRQVMLRVGPDRFSEIQKETLYAVDKKYRIMKNTMKISGIAGTILFGCAALFKIQHWPGAGIMMSLGAVILSFIFLPSALGVLWKETHNKGRIFLFVSSYLSGIFFICGTLFKIQHWPLAGTILFAGMLSTVFLLVPALLNFLLRDKDRKNMRALYILGSVALVMFVTGLIFKIQHWPLSGILLISGTILLAVIVFPWYTVKNWKNETFVSNSFIFIIVGLILIILPATLVTLNLQHTYESGYYTNQKSQQALSNYLYHKNLLLVESRHDSLNYPQLKKIHDETGKLLLRIREVQAQMIRESEGNSGNQLSSNVGFKQDAEGAEINYYMLSKPFDPMPVKNSLFPDCQSRKELENDIHACLSSWSELCSDIDIKRYNDLLDTKRYLPDSIQGKGDISMMSGLHSLELLRNGLLVAESDILKTMTSDHK